MKGISIYLDGVILDIHQSIFGSVRILCNGELISTKWCISGCTQHFKHKDHLYQITVARYPAGLSMDLLRDGLPVFESTRSDGFAILLYAAIAIWAFDFLYSQLLF